MHNDKIVAEIIASIENKVLQQIDILPSPIESSKLNTFFVEQAALEEVRKIISMDSKHFLFIYETQFC